MNWCPLESLTCHSGKRENGWEDGFNVEWKQNYSNAPDGFQFSTRSLGLKYFMQFVDVSRLGESVSLLENLVLFSCYFHFSPEIEPPSTISPTKSVITGIKKLFLSFA